MRMAGENKTKGILPIPPPPTSAIVPNTASFCMASFADKPGALKILKINIILVHTRVIS